MEFKNNKKRSKRSVDSSQNFVEYPLSLMMYNKKPPKEEIALEEFERFAIDRLKRMLVIIILIFLSWLFLLLSYKFLEFTYLCEIFSQICLLISVEKSYSFSIDYCSSFH